MSSPATLTHKPADGFLGTILDKLERQARHSGKATLDIAQPIAVDLGRKFAGVPGFSTYWLAPDKNLKLPRGTVRFVLVYREPKDESSDDQL